MMNHLIAFIASGGGELIVIMLALLLLFGPKDAPRMLRNIQNVLNKLQRAAADFRYKLMYSDQHWNQTEESKDTALYDVGDHPAEEKPVEEAQKYPPENPAEHPSGDEPKT